METELHHDRKIQNPFELFHYSTQTKATILICLIWLLKKIIRLEIGLEDNSSTLTYKKLHVHMIKSVADIDK